MQTPICEYCGSTKGIIQCQCGKYLCNGPITNCSCCQIIYHLRIHHHFSVKCGGVVVQCEECEETDVYNLRYSCSSSKLLCFNCRSNKSMEIRNEYSELLINEGSFVLTPFILEDSASCVDKIFCDGVEDISFKEYYLDRVQFCYKSIEQYCKTNTELAEIERKECSTVHEREFHKNDTLETIRFYRKGSVDYAEAKMSKVIGGLANGNKVIISCGGYRGMVNKSNRDLIRTDFEDIFKTSRYVVGGKVISSSNNAVEIKLYENFFDGGFDDGNDERQFDKSIDEIQSDQKQNTELFYGQIDGKRKKEIFGSTKLFRVYFLAMDKGNLSISALRAFSGRKINNYYSKIICCPSTFYETEHDLFSDEKVNPSSLKNASPLNIFQKKAILYSLNKEVSLVIGPPGTGKTTVAVGIAQHLIFYKNKFCQDGSNQRILVSAPSNNAVNVICEKLIEKKINVVRILADEQMGICSNAMRKVSLLNKTLEYCKINEIKEYEIKDDSLFNGHVDDYETRQEFECLKRKQQIKKIKIQELLNKKMDSYLTTEQQTALDIEEMKFRTSADLQNRFGNDFERYIKQNKKVYPLYQRRRTEITQEEVSIINSFILDYLEEILVNVQCVCATLSSCGRSLVTKQRFYASIIDEAAQSLEPETLSGVMNVRKTILIGDIQQLQPTCLSTEAKKYGFQTSMFERMMAFKEIPRTMLRTQYRMHPSLVEFPNEMFYSSQLENGITKEERTDERLNIFFPTKIPFVFIHCSGKEHFGSDGTSAGNEQEMNVVKEVLQSLMQKGIKENEIGIISPYQTQQTLILRNITEKVQVANIDGFQGNEKEIIIISCVRSNETIGVGFVGDYKRLNVAITRAKKGLIVVGNTDTLGRSEIWRLLILFYRQKKCICEWKNGRCVSFDSDDDGPCSTSDDDIIQPQDKLLENDVMDDVSTECYVSPFRIKYDLDEIEQKYNEEKRLFTPQYRIEQPKKKVNEEKETKEKKPQKTMKDKTKGKLEEKGSRKKERQESKKEKRMEKKKSKFDVQQKSSEPKQDTKSQKSKTKEKDSPNKSEKKKQKK